MIPQGSNEVSHRFQPGEGMTTTPATKWPLRGTTYGGVELYGHLRGITLKIEDLIWLNEIREKIVHKHNVREQEVIEVFDQRPYFRFVEKGHRKNENVYSTLGRTQAGRLLSVFFVTRRIMTL
jgi:uncharacterized DUF497 family protein